jgi:hypothetical protein
MEDVAKIDTVATTILFLIRNVTHHSPQRMKKILAANSPTETKQNGIQTMRLVFIPVKTIALLWTTRGKGNHS